MLDVVLIFGYVGLEECRSPALENRPPLGKRQELSLRRCRELRVIARYRRAKPVATARNSDQPAIGCALDCLYADRGYDHDKYRRLIRAKGVKHRIGRRGVEHGSGLGKHRYVVERTTTLLHWCRRLRSRWEIRDDIHEAFLSLAAALICWRRLTPLILLGALSRPTIPVRLLPGMPGISYPAERTTTAWTTALPEARLRAEYPPAEAPSIPSLSRCTPDMERELAPLEVSSEAG